MGQCDRCYREFQSQQATQQQIRATVINIVGSNTLPMQYSTLSGIITCPLNFIPANPPYRVPKGTKPSRRFSTQTVIYRLTNSMNYGHYDSKTLFISQPTTPLTFS